MKAYEVPFTSQVDDGN